MTKMNCVHCKAITVCNNCLFKAMIEHTKKQALALKDDQVLKIQVRTGRYYKETVVYSHNGLVPSHYGVVTHPDGKIHYFPALP